MNRRFRPRGFTLVELLMVITIIGLLVGIGAYAAWRALKKARETPVLMEMSSLAAALVEVKGSSHQYPPDFSDSNYSNRQARFNNYRSIAYPRSSITYAQLKAYILNNTNNSYGYNYIRGGQFAPLNLDTLDPAEALVFWLGGFPTPYASSGAPLGQKKLFGFHTDRANPFRLDAGIGTNSLSRVPSAFDFDELRLVDVDSDGWYEYVPPGSPLGTTAPPLVYFDAGGYAQLWSNKSTSPPYTGYPSQTRQGDPNLAKMSALAGMWGLAVPYASSLNNASGTPSVQWQNPQTFQIIAAGGDGMYGNPATAANVRVPCFPSGFTYQTPGLAQGFFEPQELDNLVNFSNENIDDASGDQQGLAPPGSTLGNTPGSGS